MLYGGRCWYTYDFGITYKVGGNRYVGYTGYKVCDPPVNNPVVIVDSNLGWLYNKTAPDLSGYPDFYGEEVSVGSVDPSWVRFRVVEEDVTIVSEPGDIPPDPPIDLSGFGGAGVSVWFGVATDSTYGIDILYYVNNYSAYDLYFKGEVYRDGVKICENQVSVPRGSSNVLLRLTCDAPGADGEVRLYKSKWYVSTDGSTWYHVETKWNRVAYYAPGKTVGDIVVRPNPMVYGIEMYLNKEFRNYGRSGSRFEYILMICSVDANVHQLRDELGNGVVSKQYKCRWTRVDTDTYPLGTKTKQLYLDGKQYKTVTVYGYGDGRIRRVQSVSTYNSYLIDADRAVVRSVVGDYAFDYVDGVKTVDVSQAYVHRFLGVGGFEIVNSDEFFVGYITDGNQYTKDYDRIIVKIGSITAYSGRLRVYKNSVLVFDDNINIPAGGEYSYDVDSSGEWSFKLDLNTVAHLKVVKAGTRLTLTVTPL